MISSRFKFHIYCSCLIVFNLIFIPTISAKDEFNKDANMLLFMENEIPHPDEVYKFNATIVEQKTFLRWDIKPDCYLYLNKFSFFDKKLNTHLKASFPEGEILVDEYFGKVEVFFDVVQVVLDIGKEIEKEITVTYQGCNQKRYCYTPIKKKLVIKKSGIKISN